MSDQTKGAAEVAAPRDVESLERREREAFLAFVGCVLQHPDVALLWQRWGDARRALGNAQIESGTWAAEGYVMRPYPLALDQPLDAPPSATEWAHATAADGVCLTVNADALQRLLDEWYRLRGLDSAARGGA